MVMTEERGKFMRGRRMFFILVLIVPAMLFGFNHKGLAEERYTVKTGDSLYKISKSFGVSLEVLKKVNGLDGDEIKPRQVILIPTEGEKRREAVVKKHSVETKPYLVRKGDSLNSISKSLGLSVEEIKRLNRLPSGTLKVGQVLILSRTEAEEKEEESGDFEGATIEKLSEGASDEQEAAEPLAKWNNSEERNLFVRVVKTFLGVPYRLGGSTLKGIDCSAFVKKIYAIFNIHLPRTAKEQFYIGKKIGKGELEQGDLVFFKTRRPNNAHVGIYIGNNEFVHASYLRREVKVDNLDAPYFSTHFLQGVRLKELEKES